MPIYSIYKITNSVNGKVYIGQTIKDIRIRFKEHIKSSSAESSYKLPRAIYKYGANSFSIELIETSKTKMNADDLERFYILHFKSQSDDFGYNIAPGGQGRRY